MVFCLLVCWPEYDSACVIAPILLLPNVDGGGGIVFSGSDTGEEKREFPLRNEGVCLPAPGSALVSRSSKKT